MRSPVRNTAINFALGLCLAPASHISAFGQQDHKDDVLLAAMQHELQRAQANLGKLDPALYFLSYSVYDQSAAIVIGSQGSLTTSAQARRRLASVIMRIGTPALDNAHEQNRNSAIASGTLPLEDDRDAIAHELWRLTYEEYRKASKAYLNVKTGTQVHAQEEDTSPDFSQEKPQTHADYRDPGPLPDTKALEKMVQQYSAYFRKYPFVYSSGVVITGQKTRLYFVSSEGSRVVTPASVIRVAVQAETRATDGMELFRVETFQAENLSHLPAES